MESITHTLKTLFLFYLGVQLRGLTFGPQALLTDIIFHTLYIGVIFKYYTSYKPRPVPTKDFNVCIIGAGFSGIGMGIKLREIGVKYRIIEKSERLGGTWWDNQYPGCACDIPSHLYRIILSRCVQTIFIVLLTSLSCIFLLSFSFEPNPNWTKSYSHQPEIQRYLEKVVDKYEIERKIEFGKKVTRTVWNQETSKWTIQLSNGEVFTANVLVYGGGALHVPSTPDFKGKTSFKGEAFHSAEWKRGFDPKGRRIAVIGTGATSVQIVPNIASEVEQLYVFQRTPCWVPPKVDYAFPDWVKFIFRIYPFAMFILRNYIFWIHESRYFTTIRTEGISTKRVVQVLTKHTMTEVFDGETAKKLTPSYEVACKRVTPSNGYLQSFNRDNVTLVTDGIDHITENGIKTRDGTLYEVDAIVYATGFSPIESWKVTDMYGLNGYPGTTKLSESEPEVHMNGHIPTADENVEHNKENKSTNGRINLKDEWQDAPNAYKGITYPGYPNTFFLLGPGTALGHNTAVYMIECQVAYAVDAIRNMIETDITSVDVKKRANDGYQEWVQDCMKNKVFNSPRCTSWYRNKRGLNYTLWPSHLVHYWWITRQFDINKYDCKY